MRIYFTIEFYKWIDYWKMTMNNMAHSYIPAFSHTLLDSAKRGPSENSFQLVHLCPYTVQSLYNTMFGTHKDHAMSESC